jgi:orotate phosphoribosyltransferase
MQRLELARATKDQCLLIATAISLRTGIPTLFVRKAVKSYGTCRQIEGGYRPG